MLEAAATADLLTGYRGTDMPNESYSDGLLAALGGSLRRNFESYKKLREPVEKRWMKSYRQYKGIYDPEVDEAIEDGRSHAYPRLTHVKVTQLLSKLMDLLFPVSETNWRLQPSEIPDIPVKDLQDILDALSEVAAQGEIGLSDEILEAAIKQWAEDRAEAHSKLIRDQLDEIEYIELVRKVLKSAIVYSIGVLRGPMVRPVRRNLLEIVEGQPRIRSVEQDYPMFEFVRVWDFYPDLTASSVSSKQGDFERQKLARHNLEALVERDDYLGARISKWLADNPAGNYEEESFEQSLRADNTSSPATDSETRQRSYELVRWHGYVDAKPLRDGGHLDGDDKRDEVRIEAELLGDTVIKLEIVPEEQKSAYYHTLVLDEDEDNQLLGESYVETLRDSQLGAAAAARQIMDNAGAVAGPMVEIDLNGVDHTLQDGDYSLRAFQKFFKRADEVTSKDSPVVKDITVNSHLTELLSVYNMWRELMDTEAMLPPVSVGEIAGSEALRTVGGVSQIMSAANLLPRQIIRSFDVFTTSVIQSIVEWNNETIDNPDIKGDMRVQAVGTSALMAKEVRAQRLLQLLGALPEEMRQVWVNEKRLLEYLFNANDLPASQVLNTQAEADQAQRGLEQQAQKQAEFSEAELSETLARADKLKVASLVDIIKAQQAGRMTDAQARQALASANQMNASAESTQTRSALDAAKLLLEAVQNGRGTGTET